MINIEIREKEKLSEPYSAFIKFDYNAKIVEELRALPFKYYNADRTEWEVPVPKVKALIKAFSEFQVNLSGELLELCEKPLKLELPEGFSFKTKPFSHQLEGVNYGLNNNRWFLGDEQGLGKTKQVIDIAVAKKCDLGYNHCLIICGVNTLKWNWQNEIKTHSNEGSWIS